MSEGLGLRLAALDWLSRQVEVHGEVLPWSVLLEGFEFLDAAHIVADRGSAGEPHVSNGLSLCKLHHAAFDNFFVTVDPDYRIVIRRDVLEEDGPMLRHGLQELHGTVIALPRREVWRPSREGLEERLGRFRRAGGRRAGASGSG